MSEPVNVIANAHFAEARELAAVLKELLFTGRHVGSLSRDDIVYVVACTAGCASAPGWSRSA